MIPITAALLLFTTPVSKTPDLGQQFANPPAWAKPHTWWHWMAGNVTKEGITLDLEAMKAAGIGGAHIFDAGQGIPRGPIDYNSPQWRDLMAFAMQEAKRLGLDMTMHNCSGWSSSGGPWVKPEDAMKKVVWSVAHVSHATAGFAKVSLPKPESREGFYQDIAVYAFPTPKGKELTPDQIRNWVGLGGNPGDKGVEWPVIQKPVVGTVNFDDSFNGRLDPGEWTILRLGYTLTGARNVASRPTGEGLEVDKLDADSLDRFLDGGLRPLFQRMGSLVGDPFHTVLIDSYETGFQNWTPRVVSSFVRLRGYDPRPYLPALAGYAVGDEETTRKFLFDYRRTLADLWAENYSGHFAERLKGYGLKLAVEPYGNGNFDPFTYAKPAGLIMGEYWVGEGQINGSVKPTSSVAHIYGHSVVGAEALTAGSSQAGWRNQPRQWKPFADRGYTSGINRIIYHRFAHQPWPKNVVPGMTMGPWGSHVDRTETFWSYMADWDRYLSRCQFLLQSGRFAGDICLYSGENSPQEYVGQGYGQPAIPNGYAFDYCGLDPLLSAKVKNGRVVFPSGASYRVLALPGSSEMTLAVARKVQALVKDGAIVVGPKPTGSPSLADGEKGSKAVAEIGNSLWADGKKARKIGKGWLVPGTVIEPAIELANLGPDVTLSSKNVTWIHRTIGEREAYFLATQAKKAQTVTAHFRVGKKVPELWDATTGKRTPAPVWSYRGDGVDVQVPLESEGSMFVVFAPGKAPAHLTSWTATPPKEALKDAPSLKVIKAEYGVLNQPEKVADVTERVAEKIEGDGLSFTASNEDLGGDPAYLSVKQLRLTYSYKGQTYTLTREENETVELGTRGADALPTAQVGEAIRIWQNGTYAGTSSTGRAWKANINNMPAPTVVSGPWKVRFPAGWDAPKETVFDNLISWTDHTDFGVQYFSGTATYVKTIPVPASYRKAGMQLVLDLGDVRELARVRVNGKPVATIWKSPFRVELGAATNLKELKVEVEVTNLWVNRLIGDEQYPSDVEWNGDELKGWPEWFVKHEPRPQSGRKTFTTWHHNRKDTPLLPSGLLGPVVLRPVWVVAKP